VHLTQQELEEAAEEFFAQPLDVQKVVLVGLLSVSQELARAVSKSSDGTVKPTTATNETTCAASDRAG
jgi:hypothetical protein